MVSMKDIAAKCGVSIATVSKALNDHGDIGDDTKRNIRRVAKEMGYFPNSSARALKTNRTYNIGVLFVDEDRSGLTHDYFSHVLDSFKRSAEMSGYDITFINAQGKMGMSYLEHSLYRGVDGVVIACVNFNDPDVIELINSKIPVVTIDHVFDNRISIISDNVKGMEDLVDYVTSFGHERVAYIHGNYTSVTRNRVGSFCRRMSALGHTVPDEYVVEGLYRSPEKAYETTKSLLSLKKRPTCILYPDDYSCIGGINAIKDSGLSIPNDISVAGYDGIYVSQIIAPKITTIKQDTERLGKCSAESLIKLIENPRTTLIDKLVIPGELIPGESVGRI